MNKPDDNPASPPRRKRRWLVRVPIIVVAMLVTIAVLAQIFLWTDYPRKIAQAQVERILHVRTSIDYVSIGWLGHTRIEGVMLTLPMQKEPFLTVARIDATHASLPLIAFDQNLSSVQVSGVRLTATQNAAGRWNVQQLIASGAKKTEATQQPGNPIGSLPAFQASDVRATLVRSDGKRLDLPTLEAEFKKPDALIATISARAGDVLSIEGQLGQTSALAQNLRLKFSRLPSEIAAFFNLPVLPQMQADVQWDGRLTESGVAGSLQIDRVSVDKLVFAGRVGVEVGSRGRIVARPDDISIDIANGVAKARVTGGQIAFDNALFIDNLAGSANGGKFVAGGTFDPATVAADFKADWEQITSDTLATTGSATIKTSRLFNGHLKIDAQAHGGVRLPAGQAIGALSVDGEMTSAAAISAAITLDPLTWAPADGRLPIITPRLVGNASLEGTSARLEAHAADDARVKSLAAFAGLDVKTNQWWGTFDLAALRLPELDARGIKGPVDASVALAGLGTKFNVNGAYVKFDKATAYTEGVGDIAPPRLLKMAAWAWYDKPVTEDEAAQLNSLKLVSTIEGTLEPRDLKAEVDLAGSELVFATRKVGDVALHVTATLGEDEAALRSQELEALGGHWSLRGRWSRNEGGPPTIVADFRDIPLANLGAMIGRDDIGGQIETGSATLRLRSSRLDQLEMTAKAHGGSLIVGPFRAESLDLSVTAKAGQFEVKPTLHEAGGTITAVARGDVSLAGPIKANVTLDNWPAPYVESTVAGAQRFRPRATGSANAEVLVRTGSISGDVALAGTVERGEEKLADYRIEGTLHDKLISVTRFSLDTLDGALGATAQIDLANYNGTVVDATFERLTPARLAWSNPILGEVGGQLSGTLRVRPSTDRRAIGPLELELKMQPVGMAFRGIRVGDVNVLAYADAISPDEFRFVTDQAIIHVAGGTIEPFARLTNEPSRGLAQLITAKFDSIDLGEVVRAADNDGKDLVGKVAGNVRVYGQATNLKTLTGDASINITESDLANFGPIAALYNVLSVGAAGNQPDGAGNVTLRFGGDSLTIEDATYFNRGVYANAFGSVNSLSNGTEASVDHALVVGSLQPLRAVKLPFFGDLNDTLAALQSSVTAIDVTGTLKEPKMQQVSIGALGDTFQKLLLGKMREKK